MLKQSRYNLSKLVYFYDPCFKNWDKVQAEELPVLPPMPNLAMDQVKPFERHSVLTKSQERYAFLKYNHVRYLLCRYRDGELRASEVPRRHLRHRCRSGKHPNWVFRDFREMWDWEDYIVRSNLGLVVHFAGLCVKHKVDRELWRGDISEEMVAHGTHALLRAVRHFNPQKKLKFSTYASNAVLREFSRVLCPDRTQMALHSIQLTGAYDFKAEGIQTATQQAMEKSTVTLIKDIIEHNRAGLNPLELKIIFLRVMRDYDDQLALKVIGAQVGVTQERIRQIEGKTLLKLRAYMLEHHPDHCLRVGAGNNQKDSLVKTYDSAIDRNPDSATPLVREPSPVITYER